MLLHEWCSWLPCQEESDEDDEPAEASVTAEEMEEWKARLLRPWCFDRVVHLRCAAKAKMAEEEQSWRSVGFLVTQCCDLFSVEVTER